MNAPVDNSYRIGTEPRWISAIYIPFNFMTKKNRSPPIHFLRIYNNWRVFSRFWPNDIRIQLKNSEPNDWNSMVLEHEGSAINSAPTWMHLNCIGLQLSEWQALINVNIEGSPLFLGNDIQIPLDNSDPNDWNSIVPKQEGSMINFASTQINLARVCPQLGEWQTLITAKKWKNTDFWGYSILNSVPCRHEWSYRNGTNVILCGNSPLTFHSTSFSAPPIYFININ